MMLPCGASKHSLRAGAAQNSRAHGVLLLSGHCQHAPQAVVSAAPVAATATMCAPSAAAVAFASGAEQPAVTLDPALDSLIDRWLSHRQTSTSTASGSNGSSSGNNGGSGGGGNNRSSSSRGRKRQTKSSEEPPVEWATLLGPVAVNVASLATLEEGDEVFALSDSLSHLGSSLQELQLLASQLLQQQQQVPVDTSLPQTQQEGAQQYPQQLCQLLDAAAQQAAALDDAALLNLLGIATVLLTPVRGGSSSSSAGSAGDARSSSSTDAVAGAQEVHAAATAALQAACAEMWQRPQVVSGLDASQLTSLAVVLRRLHKLGLSNSLVPVSLPLAAYQRLQQLLEQGQLTACQLGVCCWCLSSLAAPPPAAAVVAALNAAEAQIAAACSAGSIDSSSSSSSDALDSLTLRRLLAACVNWRVYVAGQLQGSAADANSSIGAAAAGLVQNAAQWVCMQLSSGADSSEGSSSSGVGEGSSSSSSSSREDEVWKAAAAVAQAAAAYHTFPGDGFAAAVAAQLLTQPIIRAASEEAHDVSSAQQLGPAASSRHLLDAVAAAGCLLPWWGVYQAEQQQQQLLQAVYAAHQQQQQQLPLQQQEVPVLQVFLNAVHYSVSHLPSQLVGATQQQLHSVLQAVAEHLLTAKVAQISAGRGSSAVHLTCVSLLLASMTACNCRSEQVLQLAAATAQACSASDFQTVAAEAPNSAGVTATAAAAAAAALCRLQPEGWQQQLQRLAAVLLESEPDHMQQLQLGELMSVHASVAAAAAHAPAAAELTSAVLQQLLLPSILPDATAQQAADMLVLLTVGEAPWGFAAGQQLQPRPPAGLLQLNSSSSSSSSGSSSSEADATRQLQQQCLRCMNLITKDSGRSLLPRQLAPLLAALTFMQQQQQQQTQHKTQQCWWGMWGGQELSAYQQLHREVLAAVSLQLQDSASLLAPSDLACTARLLALLQYRPVLALAAVVQAAAQCQEQLQQQDLVWLLWGLTKLQCLGQKQLQHQLLSGALQSAVAMFAAADAAGVGAADADASSAEVTASGATGAQQQQEQEASSTAAAAAADAAAAAATDASGQSNVGSPVQLHTHVALLWVATSRGLTSPSVLQLLSHITQQQVTLDPAQLASVLWSYTKLAQGSLPQQLQQQLLQQKQQVLELVETGLAGGSGTNTTGPSTAQLLQPRQVAVICWGLHRLGHTPSSAAAAALVAAALQHMQQTSPDTSNRPADFLPGELSCFLFCLAKWSIQLEQQQVQQLEVCLQQQLQQGLGVAAPSSSSSSSSGSNSNSSNAVVGWDGPAVCSACWALTQLGAGLQAETLAAAEQHLTNLLPEVPLAPAATEEASSSTAEQQQQQQLPWWSLQSKGHRQQQRLAPSASDLVMFGVACKASSYQPTQLLQRFRSLVLLRLAAKGAAGLQFLQPRAPQQQHMLGSLTGGILAAADPKQQQQQLQLSGPQQQQRRDRRRNHTHLLVSCVLFLRQVGFRDPALLQQLEAASVNRPAVEQLTAKQISILLSSFLHLGHVPELWLNKAGVRRIMHHVQQHQTNSSSQNSSLSDIPSSTSSSSSVGSWGRIAGGLLSALDCVELMECLAAWQHHPGLAGNTALVQWVLPGLAQLLLGVTHTPEAPPARLGSSTAAGSSNSSSSGGGGSDASSSPADSVTSSTSSSSNTNNRASSSTSGVNLVAIMPGWQATSLLRSCVSLGLPFTRKPYQLLLQQLVRRLRQVWQDLTVAEQVAAAHAAGRAGVDLSGLLDTQQLLPQASTSSMQQQQSVPQQPQQQQQQSVPQQPQQQQQSLPQQPQQQRHQRGGAAAEGAEAWAFDSAAAACRLLWVFGNVGRNPGPQVLEAALSRVASAGAAAVAAGQLLPLRQVSTALYAAAVLQELSSPAAVALAQLLLQAAESGQLLSHPQFAQQSEQLAACLVAALDAADTAATSAALASNVAAAPGSSSKDLEKSPPPAATAAQGSASGTSSSRSGGGSSSSTSPSVRSNNPWVALPLPVQQRLLEACRRKALLKAGRRGDAWNHMPLLLSLRRLGVRGRAKAVTEDGCVCIDVAASTPQGDRIAVEMLGPHNAAANTQRPLGPARLKWRMLSARGYKVVVVNMWTWNTLDSGGLVSRASLDGGGSSGSSGSSGGGSSGSSGVESSMEEYEGAMLSEQVLYLQSRLQAALGPAAVAALAAGSRTVRPLPQQLPSIAGSSSLQQAQQLQQQAGASRRLFQGPGV